MKKIVLFLAALIVTLCARDNPFEPVMSPYESGKVANTPEPNYFTPQSLQLPSSARKIKKISIEFQNMDGSIDTVKKDLNNEIDWHFPLLVQQQQLQSMEKTAPAKQTDTPKQPTSPKISQKMSFEPLGFISFHIENKTVNIDAENEIIRDFALAEPTKIVLDFKRDANFYSKNIETKMAFFKNIAIGNHEGYFRVAIELDGKYRYKLEKRDGGYRIELE